MIFLFDGELIYLIIQDEEVVVVKIQFEVKVVVDI